MKYLNKKVKIADITIPEDRKGRRQTLGDIQGLAVSIHRYGLMNPITVTKNLELLAGERRLTACKNFLKLTEIEVRIPTEEGGEELDEFAQTELKVIENAHREQLTYDEQCDDIRAFHDVACKKAGRAVQGRSGGWTIRDTATTLGVSVGTVSTALQLSEAFGEHPELRKAENKVTAFKLLKRDEIQQAQLEVASAIKDAGFSPDCLKLGDNLPILKGMASESFAYVNMDPPYGIGYNKGKEITETWGDVYPIEDIPHEIFNKLALVLKECFRLLIPGGHLHVWYHMQHHIIILGMLREAGFDLNPVPFYWVKSKHGRGISKYTHSNATEPAIHAWKGKPRECNKSGQLNYSLAEKVPDQQKIHPTEKPVSLYRQMIELYSRANEPILDPYCGSGAMLRAGFQLDRKPIGIELSQTHYDSALAALVKEMAQLTAVHESSSGEGEII